MTAWLASARGVGIAGLEIGAAAAEPGRDVLGLQRDGVVVILDRGFIALFREEQMAAIEIGLRIAGRQLHPAVEIGHGLLVLLAQKIGRAAFGIGLVERLPASRFDQPGTGPDDRVEGRGGIAAGMRPRFHLVVAGRGVLGRREAGGEKDDCHNKDDPQTGRHRQSPSCVIPTGRQTVEYVGNIYKYYVAYKLAEERRAAVK